MSDTTLTPSATNPAASTSSLAGPRDYYDLMKPRVMSLVIFTAFVGMVIAPGTANPVLAAISLLAIAVGAGASGALNMWWDADIDAVMARTVARPVPSGRVPAAEAAAFGGFLSALSVALLALSSNYVAAGLLAFTIFFYAVIYSMWLKRSTAQNIVIGGAAGAFPPVIGWAAITGTAPLDAWILFAVIFLWTPPHFWALALYKRHDYERASVPMMPVVKGETSTRRQIFAYSLVLALAGAAPALVGLSGLLYFIISSVLGAIFVWYAYKVWRDGEREYGNAKKLFRFSILYLFAIFALILIDRVVMAYV